jgi:hypothetical protein
MCVDRRHGRGAFNPRPEVLFFDRRIDAAALVAACESVLGAARDPPSPKEEEARPSPPAQALPTRHYLIVPNTPTYATFAARAGARPERWREDIVEDLVAGGLLRIAPSRLESVMKGRARLLGARFALEVAQDRLRKDAFFAYRIERVRSDACEKRIDVPAGLAMVAPGKGVPGLAQADPVAPLLLLRSDGSQTPME